MLDNIKHIRALARKTLYINVCVNILNISVSIYVCTLGELVPGQLPETPTIPQKLQLHCVLLNQLFEDFYLGRSNTTVAEMIRALSRVMPYYLSLPQHPPIQFIPTCKDLETF